MNYVASNPDLPICPDCNREFYPEMGSVIHPGLDVWCAKRRIEEENAEKAAESALDPEAFVAATIAASIPKAVELLGERFFKAPHLSADRDNRELESR